MNEMEEKIMDMLVNVFPPNKAKGYEVYLQKLRDEVEDE